MQYTKPELNEIGAAEGLVLGPPNGSMDGGNAADQHELGSLEFEE
jgi:hypothetical protein